MIIKILLLLLNECNYSNDFGGRIICVLKKKHFIKIKILIKKKTQTTNQITNKNKILL